MRRIHASALLIALLFGTHVFGQLDKIVRGTDRFSNSTGRLIFLTGIGRQGGGFDSHVRGELCVND